MSDISTEIVAIMRHPVLLLDGELRVRLANPVFCAMFHVSREETENRFLYDLGNGQWNIPSLRRLMTKLVQNSPEIRDYRVDHDFERIGRRTMLLNARRLDFEERRYLLLAIEDVTERERLLWELTAEKEFAEKIVDASRESLLILDRDLRVIGANETFYHTFRVKKTNTEGRLVYDLGDGQWNIPALRDLLQNVLPENETFNDYEVLHDFETIGRRDMILNGRKIDHRDWILLAIEDVTERKQFIRALRQESDERLRKVLETETVGVVFFNESGTLIGANDAFLKMTGYNHHEVEGAALTWRDITPPEWQEVMTGQWQRLQETGRMGPYEKELLLKNGSRSAMLFSGRSLGDGTVVEYCFDISDRKAVEEQRELLLAELNHRVKNVLAVVQRMAARTIRRSRSLEEFSTAFEGRLAAIARGHDQLFQSEWKSLGLHRLVGNALSAFGPGRVSIDGPSADVSSKTALALTLVLHELETNSVKFGALSVDDGHVTVVWNRKDREQICMTWQESGGPRVTPPRREGFGTWLIRRLVEYEMGGEASIHFEQGGLRSELTFAADLPAPA